MLCIVRGIDGTSSCPPFSPAEEEAVLRMFRKDYIRKAFVQRVPTSPPLLHWSLVRGFHESRNQKLILNDAFAHQIFEAEARQNRFPSSYEVFLQFAPPDESVTLKLPLLFLHLTNFHNNREFLEF